MTGLSDNNRNESQGGTREGDQLKEGRSEGTTVGTRTGREAAMRAMSVRENAKSNSHRKTHRVEPGGTGRKFMHLTRGGLGRESVRGVSRSRSSEEGRESGWSEGLKNCRRQSTDGPISNGRVVPRNIPGVAITAASGGGGDRRRGGSTTCPSHAAASPMRTRKEVEEDA
jgi:hypothetical protein